VVVSFPGSRIRGDGSAVQWCPEEAGLAVTPDLPRAQHCLQGRPAAVLLRTLLPPTLPGTRSAYTRLDYLHKRDRALVFLPFSPIATRSVALSASSGRSGDRAERRVQRAGRRRSAASPGRELVQPLQRDPGVSRGEDRRRQPSQCPTMTLMTPEINRGSVYRVTTITVRQRSLASTDRDFRSSRNVSSLLSLRFFFSRLLGNGNDPVDHPCSVFGG